MCVGNNRELLPLLPHLSCSVTPLCGWMIGPLRPAWVHNMLFNSEYDEYYCLLTLTCGDTSAVKHHIKVIKTKCGSSSSFRERVNMNVYLQPDKEIMHSYSVHSDRNACVGATERSIYISPKNRNSFPQSREILQSGELLCRCCRC